jgi:hypothetical protein
MERSSLLPFVPGAAMPTGPLQGPSVSTRDIRSQVDALFKTTIAERERDEDRIDSTPPIASIVILFSTTDEERAEPLP